MRIAQVTPGIISIPPNGWGAIEKVIWNYKISLEQYGHSCDIKYLDDVDVNNIDIVHIHVANLAIEAKKRGIPYIFSLHDHHVYRFGKQSQLYKENLEAIKGSVISFTHAEFLIDFFDETDKLFYLSHGVDITYFYSERPKREIHKLLCVANNGYADDKTVDRKGFRIAIEAAKKLNMPITIVGPENNLNFFNQNKDLLEYEKLNLITRNVSEDELLEIYREHSIFLHPSELEAGQPNLTILEAISTFMPVVGMYDGTPSIEGMIRSNRSLESVVSGINKVMQNYDLYIQGCSRDRENFDWFIIVNRLRNIYNNVLNIKKELGSNQTREVYIDVYENSNIRSGEHKRVPMEKLNVSVNFVNGARVELGGISGRKYEVQFWDGDNLVFKNEIGVGCWCAPNRKYFTNWNIKIYTEGNLVYSNTINLNNKRVYLAIDSSSIGDTLAWMPYMEEFRKRHNCKLIASTFWNDLFESRYSEIEFVNPGDVVNDLCAMYTVGCFYDESLEPELCSTIPLQKVATNILGLEYKEIRPLISIKKSWPFSLTDKYVVIAPHSTAGLKYWNNPTGWQEVVDFLRNNGYKVYNVSREGCELNGVKNLKDYNIDTIINCIKGSEFFIGLSSGLSWLAWTLDKKVVLISNFTNEEHEFSDNCIRITNKNVCNSCWVKPEFRFDKGDWNWCPIHKGTDRQFECSKSITGQMVISEIQKNFEL